MASTLRRRPIVTTETSSSLLSPSPSPSLSRSSSAESHALDGSSNNDSKTTNGTGIDRAKNAAKKAVPKTVRKRWTTTIFLLGSVFGIILAGFLARESDLLEMGDFMSGMDSFLDGVLPAGLVRDMKDLVRGEREFVDSYDAFSVGLKARAAGLEAVHPIVMIPGVISTGLESWDTNNNASRPYFRKRLWGSWTMMRALVLDKELWKRHIMLDKVTGMDPEGIKLRPAQGFDATDFFITGYWIWSKLLENLASIGYDPTNSYTAAYDWRLSYRHLETRDHYFTRLKYYVEMAYAVSGKKVVLASHSMGGQVTFYFFHWVASPLGGKGGDDWVEKYVEAWINISGCMLGAAKDVPAVLSGEMRDTAQLNPFAVYGLDKFLSKDERAELFRAMPGISSMLPKGGDAVWGNLTWAPDDPSPGHTRSYGAFMNFRKLQNWTVPSANFTMDDAMHYLLNNTESWYRDAVENSYSHGVAHTTAQVDENENNPAKWINPLETRLPLSPSLKIYCFYGVGKPTERSYFYRSPPPESRGATKLNMTIDTALTIEDVDHGVILGEGDGTVNLLSSGYMCQRGWGYRRYNPAGIKVTTVEMPHQPHPYHPRGGPNTADHVDILGRQSLNELVLRVAAGRGADVREQVVSRIKEYAGRVRVFEEGEEGEGG